MDQHGRRTSQTDQPDGPVDAGFASDHHRVMTDFDWNSPDAGSDARLHSPSCERNREPILEVLRDVLPARGLVLEVGSGTGQHAAFFAQSLPRIEWQPSDRTNSLESIAAWREAVGAVNIQPPMRFDLFDERAPVEAAAAVVCINAIHIAPWKATERLFHHAASLLSSGAPVFLYGPFRYEGRPLEPSNEQFDRWLQERDPQSGIRVFEEVNAIAEEHGFRPGGDEPMPANNRSVWWVREG